VIQYFWISSDFTPSALIIYDCSLTLCEEIRAVWGPARHAWTSGIALFLNRIFLTAIAILNILWVLPIWGDNGAVCRPLFCFTSSCNLMFIELQSSGHPRCFFQSLMRCDYRSDFSHPSLCNQAAPWKPYHTHIGVGACASWHKCIYVLPGLVQRRLLSCIPQHMRIRTSRNLQTTIHERSNLRAHVTFAS